MLTVNWANLLAQCHARAWGRLQQTLLGRGFLASQLAAWDYGAQYERDLTLYFALVRGGCLDNFGDKFIELLDVRKEVAEMPALSVGGVFQDPQGSRGVVTVGTYDGSTDLFGTPVDPQDSRLGQPARW